MSPKLLTFPSIRSNFIEATRYSIHLLIHPLLVLHELSVDLISINPFFIPFQFCSFSLQSLLKLFSYNLFSLLFDIILPFQIGVFSFLLSFPCLDLSRMLTCLCNSATESLILLFRRGSWLLFCSQPPILSPTCLVM